MSSLFLVALISPSYFTPMENVEKTANVLCSWGFEPVLGPNVGKKVDGQYHRPRNAHRRPHATGRKN